MGLESLTETGLTAAFTTATNALAVAYRPHYRCAMLDDDPTAERELRRYPFVEIVAHPNVPDSHKSTFRHIPVDLVFATHKDDDRKGLGLKALYEACRAVIDTESGVTITGYSVIGILIQEGGQREVDENEQRITLPLIIKVCAA